MVKRTRQTSPASPYEQPVWVYKLIAFTFLTITIVLFGVIFFMSTKRAVITVETKAKPVTVQAVVRFGGASTVDGMVSSTIVRLEKTFLPTGSSEVPGVAEGKVVIFNESQSPQPLVATTRLQTPEGVLFRLKKAVVVPADGSVEAEVYADQPGSLGDIGPADFSIPGLNETRRRSVFAKSFSPMIGGLSRVGILSEDDLLKAKTTFLEEAKNLAISSLSTSFQGYGSSYLINFENVSSTVPVGQETSRFTLAGTVEVVGVFYDERALSSWADEQLRRRAVDDSEVVRQTRELPSVTIKKYNSDKNEAEAEIFIDGVATLNTDSPQLAKSMFFGKSKDEVRRYVLSLDHVRGVDVSFSPSWMLSVPHVEDRLTVVVKQVE